MFCPKCGSQNSDETMFCRGCGVDLSNVLAVVPNSLPGPPVRPLKRLPLALGQEPGRSYLFSDKRDASSEPQSLAEKSVELSSAGWRGLIGGVGFLIVAGLSFGISERLAVLGLFMLAFATVFLAGGVSRFVQSRGLKRLSEAETSDPTLMSGQPDYIQPTRRLFETDDLTDPPSITEHTTTHLR